MIRYCNDNLSAHWFFGYNIDQCLPVHSTLLRTRMQFSEQVYEQVFTRNLGLCVDAGLVEGARQVVDSSLIKANAHIDSMQRQQILEDASEYCRQVNQENGDDEPSAGPPSPELKPVDLPPENEGSKYKARITNKTNRCSSDPDARKTE